MIRRPGLLSPDLVEVARLGPSAGTLTLKMVGASEATLTLSEDAPALRIHDWISIYSRRGFCGVFRISNIVQTYRRQLDVTMLHGIDILADSAWEAQMEFSGTKAQYLTQLLNQQTHLINGVKPWVLGTCEDTSTYKKSINYDRLSSLMQELEEEGSGYYFTYDQTVFPWVVNYVAKNQEITSEFRLTRNVRSASVTYNDADLCTRLHLSINVKAEDEDTEVHSTDTIIKTYNNTAAQEGPNGWGVVVKTADIDTHDDLKADPPVTTEADAWAANFLARRAEPTVQIQIDGEELRGLTGESWDEADIGRICQVAIPAYGHTFLERVVSIAYPELYKDDLPNLPYPVTVSLANTLPKFSETIASIRDKAERAARAARGGGRGAADAKELLTWSQHVQYYGEALDGSGILTLYESGIDMDAIGGVTISSLQEGLQALYAGIQVNSSAITSVVQKSGVNELGANETLYSKVTQTATDITSEVARATAAEGSLSTRITQTAESITSTVNGLGGRVSTVEQRADSITSTVSSIDGRVSTLQQTVDGISITGNTIAIKGTTISLDGFVSATDFNAEKARIDALYGGSAQVEGLYSKNGITALKFITAGTYVNAPDVQISGTSLKSAIVDFGTATYNGNNVTIPTTKADGTAGPSINFNKPGQGTITAITKSGQTWKPNMTGTTHGGFEVNVYASGTNVGTFSTTIDVDAAYAWSAGWAEGYDDCEAEFSATSVTKQGTAVSITGLGQAVTVARAGTSVSVHKRGSAVSVTRQGSAVSVTPVNAGSGLRLAYYNTTQLYRLANGAYTKVGDSSRQWYYIVSSGGTVRYTAGSAITYYNEGSAATYYYDGGTATYYNEGDTATYYVAGAAATYYYAGSAATYYTRAATTS